MWTLNMLKNISTQYQELGHQVERVIGETHLSMVVSSTTLTGSHAKLGQRCLKSEAVFPEKSYLRLPFSCDHLNITNIARIRGLAY
jgi:hypothetical protein